tara:strand:- start:964 stop:1245 length:282 start_codon:yes stop_codon:yes gene_type:complete
MSTKNKEIKFVQGIYADQYKDWLYQIKLKKEDWEKQYEKLKEEFEDEDYVKFEMKLSKKDKWYFKELDKKPEVQKAEEVKAADHSPDRDDLPF